VAGDPMHPRTPDLGQGGCCILEDAVVLARNAGGGLSSEGRIISQKRVEEGIESYVMGRRWRVAGSYFSRWDHQWSRPWAGLVKSFRDYFLYRFFYPRMNAAIQYDCGVLSPAVQLVNLTCNLTNPSNRGLLQKKNVHHI